MMKNIRTNFLTVALSNLSIRNRSKINLESELGNYQSEEYQADTNSQQYLHPYLVNRVEPSVHHIIFSSYIRF